MPQPDDLSDPVESLGGCFLRLLSTLGGLFGLVALGLVIARQPAWTLGPTDLGFALVLLAALTATWLDRIHGQSPGPRLAAGRRWASVLTLLALGIWLGAQSFQLGA